MTNDVIYILANAVAGGIGGYYTNDYAVKMIFRKYWGMGGVILDTRPQFIENMSNLVERDVLNVHTIAPALNGEQSKQVLEQVIVDFWHKMQGSTEETLTLGQVKGVNQSTAALLDFYSTYAQDSLGKVLGTLLQNISLTDVLTGEQQQFFSRKLYTLCREQLANSKVIEEALAEYYDCYATTPITEFVPAEFFHILTSNLSAGLDAIPSSIDKATVEDQLDRAIEQTYLELHCDKLLQDLEENIKSKTLAEILGYERAQGITQALLDKFVAVLSEPGGRELLDTLAAKLIHELKQIDVSIYSLLNTGMRSKLDAYLERCLPWFIEQALIWIRDNRPELESLINKAVDEVLSDDDDLLGLKNDAKRLLKEVFIGDVAAKYELIEKISDYIKTGSDPQHLARELSEYLITQLKGRRIGELIGSLETLNIIKSSDGAKIVFTVLEKYLPCFEVHNFDTLFNKPLGDFVQIELSNYFAEYFKYNLKKYLLDKLLCAPNGSAYIRQELHNSLMNLEQQNIGYFLGMDSIEQIGMQCEQALQEYLRTHEVTLSNTLVNNVNLHLKDKSLDWVINDEIQDKLKRHLSEQSYDKLSSLLEDYKSKKMVDLYNKLSGKLNAEQLSSFLGSMLTGSLDEFLRGKVAKAVSDNLNDLSNEELQELTESFMGTELGPISKLGGAMGTIIGGAAAAAGWGAVSSNVVVNTAAGGGLFAAIGWMTNVVAIQMIFRPYQQWKVAGMGIPMTPGVIPKQKPRFARAMGDFVDQKLFVQERAAQEFLSKRQEATDSLLELADSTGYTYLQSLLHIQHEQLSRKTLDFIYSGLCNNQASIQTVLCDEFSSTPLGVLDYDWLSTVLATGSEDILGHADKFLQDQLGAMFTSQASLGETIPGTFKRSLNTRINKTLADNLNLFLEQLQDEKQFNMLLDSYSSNFDAFVQTPIKDIIAKEKLVYIKYAVCRSMIDMLQDQDSYQRFYDWLNAKLEQELHSERRLGDVLGGSLMQLVKDCSAQILSSVLKHALMRLQDNREAIKQDFHSRFMESSGLMLKAANMILDIDSTIYQTIDRLLDIELPKFANDRTDELQVIITQFVDEQLSETKIGELGIAVSYRQLMELVNGMVQSKHTANALNSLLDDLMDKVFTLTIQDILQVSNFRSLQSIYRKFWPEISIMRYQLANNIYGVHTRLVERAAIMIEKFFLNNLYDMPICRVISGIKPEQLLAVGAKLMEQLRQTAIFDKHLANYAKQLEYELRFANLNKLLDIELLSHDLINSISRGMDKKEVYSQLLNDIHEFFGHLIDSIHSVVDAEAKAYFIKAMVTASVESISTHFEKLLRALDIRAIAVKQIEAMSAENIKQMFDSFAAVYFRRIERYGLIAGLLGLITAPLLALLR